MDDEHVDREEEAAGATGKESRTAGDPAATTAGSRRPVPWLVGALALVVIGAVVAIVFLLQMTVPNGDLEAAEVELAGTRAELAVTEEDLEAANQQAASDMAAAADREANLKLVISGLEDDVSALEADLAARGRALVASQAAADSLEEELSAAHDRADAAEDRVESASGSIKASFDMWSWYVAWSLWAGNDIIRDLERDNADLVGHDEIAKQFGLGDTWKEWAGKEGREPLRELNGLMDRIDHDELQILFDVWFDCETRRECVQATVALDAALLAALTDELQATGEALGRQLLSVSAV